MVDFVKIYGTHYHKAITFGAQMIYERRYSNASKTKGDKETREECTGTTSLKKFISSLFQGLLCFVKMFLSES